MSNKKLIKSTSSVRSRKFPPPLNLPSIPNEHNTSEQNSSINDYSCSSFPCSHQSISYTLPTCQRPQIFQRLQDSSSSLLVTPSRRSQSLKISNQLKQRQTGNVPDQQWIDCICLIISKSLKNEIEVLLDKYKTNYFDRINASDTSDEIIRTSLCEMVAQTLATYSTSSSAMTNYNATRTFSSNKPISNVSKRKHDDIDGTRCEFCSISVNDQTKFVISYIIPGKCANIANSDQEISKQFQTKFSHLFTYIPDEYIQSYLTDNALLKPQKPKICLMLYDDIVTFMNESDLQLSGISLDQAFTLPNSILQHIHSYVH